MDVKEFYSNLYNGLEYGGPRPIKAITHAAFLAAGLTGKEKILVIGAGNGYEVVYLLKKGFDCYSLDVYAPDLPFVKRRWVRGWAQELPFKDKVFDIVLCCETMEHIPEELTDPVLKESKRVAKRVYFTVATREDPPFDSHVNVKHPCWWIAKFEELGYDIINAQVYPWFAVAFQNCSMLFRYEEGVLIYARC